jgi:hypothetical protein
MAQILYGKTLILANIANLKTELFKAGQWVQDANTGIRGQYLGKTDTGCIVIRWQHGKFGRIADTKSNRYLRQFARVNGAK